MPTISIFYGIVIQMHWRDHNPPHFHAVYGEYDATVELAGLTVLSGSLPPRALAMVREWATEHREQLLDDWRLCSELKTPRPIPPLKR